MGVAIDSDLWFRSIVKSSESRPEIDVILAILSNSSISN